jgi:mRNA interferase RelE/StbE
MLLLCLQTILTNFMYDIEFSKQAIKDLKTIQKDYAFSIIEKIKKLALDPYKTPLDIKKLKGEEAYRLRVGDYRVIYEIEGRKLLINIVKIQIRGSVYG